ncbi:RRP15-like protein [Actinia tenebrosa]|uniref:RRP15-like protein n=1 Tax=Actinia tenebrosa TaxID=6105 RepID=A0A6P8HWC4_ACTTE|nr:RRP15-like protein [Actinia tenebrosa]
MAVNTVDVQYSDEEKMSDQESVDEDNHNNDAKSGNEGWADAMAKILGKQLPEEKPAVLTKYKKGNKRKSEKKEEIKQKKKRADQRHTMFEKDHVVPDRSNLTYDRELVHIATRGVVKLFNAVSKHQKDTEAKLKKATTEVKKSKVMESMNKTAFLDLLKSNSDEKQDKKKMETELNKGKNKQTEEDKSSSWNILRDDFMMGAKMKDWDKEDGNEKKKKKTMDEIKDYELGDVMNDADVDDDDDSHDEASSESD